MQQFNCKIDVTAIKWIAKTLVSTYLCVCVYVCLCVIEWVSDRPSIRPVELSKRLTKVHEISYARYGMTTHALRLYCIIPSTYICNNSTWNCGVGVTGVII